MKNLSESELFAKTMKAPGFPNSKSEQEKLKKEKEKELEKRAKQDIAIRLKMEIPPSF
mgnify:CR=1 FL=1